MKKMICSLLVASSLITLPVSSAKAADVVLITTGGIVATLAIAAVAGAGYGTTVLALGLSGKTVHFKMENYEQALDVVASGDEKLINQELREFLNNLRDKEPTLNEVDDITILTSVIDYINEN